MRLGIDAGGTFTDFVVLQDDGRISTFKLRSNPESPASVILEGMRRAGVADEVVHGSTVATNALLERKGARTALITTRGFEDVLVIGRQNRPELYNLTPRIAPPLVAAEDCIGANERIVHDGTILRDLTAQECRRVARAVKKLGVRAVAISLLHAYENPAHEKLLAEELAQLGVYLSASHEVSPEFREYERTSTTVINSYVGPLMNSYLGEVEQGCASRLFIMQSNGGLLTASEARKQAVRTVLSGPAGGIAGASHLAALAGFPRAITFDMGGTSTDVSLVERPFRLSSDTLVDGFPVRVPMLSIHTVGAGGGSIARTDEGGRLLVGPESAGARPGPACYGVGEDATVTDAHVVLGRISAEQFLGGEMRIDPARSERAIASAGTGSMVATAAGIIRVVNSNMEHAIRVVSVERGEDPRELPLVAFGGGGGLHACELAEALGISTVLVPRDAAVLSALGMLLADQTRDYSCGALGARDIERRFVELETRAARDLPGAKIERSADLRYRGQSYELTVPWNPRKTGDAFHAAHQQIYGYADREREVEVVTLRVQATLPVRKPTLDAPRKRIAGAKTERRVFVSGRWRKIPVLAREAVGKRPAKGPALILDYGATTIVPSGWSYRADGAGNLLLAR
jgi:N-methylhydantoinase A/oxoprolinase/acetone carboxylase beta subunit